MGTSQTILWIDSDCFSLQNSLINFNFSFNFTMERFNNIQDGINRIKKIKWQKVIVIIRGSMIRDLISAIELNKKDLFCIIDMIVFTRHKEETKQLCKTDEVISSSGYLFNDSNILENTDEIINCIKNKKYLEPEDFGSFGKFLKIDNFKQIIYPLYYTKIFKPISKEEIIDFNNYLKNCFGDQVKKLIEQLESNSNIPNEIICKYWARTYTFDSNFYGLMNKRLRQKEGKMFIPFIKMMYEGINNGVFTPNQRREENRINTLYRGSKITIRELNRIKGYLRNNNNNDENRLKCLLYTRPFLSFSKNRGKAEGFMGLLPSPKGQKKVLFVLNNDQTEGVSYASFKEYSFYCNEQEVLFFPYSCFEVKEINEIEKLLKSYVEIKLGYIGTYKNNLESYYSNEENLEDLDDIPNTEYEREISELGLISNNYKKYWKVVKEIKIDEGNVSCILYFDKGKFLFSINHKIKFYDFVFDKNLQSIENHTDDITDLLKLNEEKFISSSKDKTIKIFNFYSNRFNLIKTLDIHQGQVNQVIKLNLSDHFASCSDDKTIKFWNFDFNRNIYSIEISLLDDEDIISIHELKKEYLVYISKSGNLKFLSKDNEKWSKIILKLLENPLKNCFSVWNEDILILGTKNSIFLIDILQQKIIKKFPHQHQASSIGFLKENLLFGLKEESNLCLLNEFSIDDSIDNLEIECIGQGKDFCLEINQIQILDENTLVTANKNNYIKIWERSYKNPNFFMYNNKIKNCKKDSSHKNQIINNYHKKDKMNIAN